MQLALGLTGLPPGFWANDQVGTELGNQEFIGGVVGTGNITALDIGIIQHLLTTLNGAPAPSATVGGFLGSGTLTLDTASTDMVQKITASGGSGGSGTTLTTVTFGQAFPVGSLMNAYLQPQSGGAWAVQPVITNLTRTGYTIAVSPLPVIVPGCVLASNTTVTNPNGFPGVVQGMGVNDGGNKIPSSTTVSSYNPGATTMTISHAATGSLTESLNFTSASTTYNADVLVVVTRPQNQPVAAGDSFSFSDAATRLVIGSDAAGDTWSITEAATRAQIVARSTADSWGVTEAATRAQIVARSTADSWGVTEAAIRAAQSFTRVGADTWSITEAATRIAGPARTTADAWSITEAASAVSSPTRTASVTWSFTEAANQVSALPRAASVVWSFSDSATGGGSGSRTASDTWPITDSAIGGNIFQRTASVSWSFTETSVRSSTGVRTATDTWSITESAASRLRLATSAAVAWPIAEAATATEHGPFHAPPQSVTIIARPTPGVTILDSSSQGVEIIRASPGSFTAIANPGPQ